MVHPIFFLLPEQIYLSAEFPEACDILFSCHQWHCSSSFSLLGSAKYHSLRICQVVCANGNIHPMTPPAQTNYCCHPVYAGAYRIARKKPLENVHFPTVLGTFNSEFSDN
jgi:hypothetical protein